jgi:hypothetical protein
VSIGRVVTSIELYLDEDARDSDFVSALRARGVTVITASDAGLIQKSDEEHLAFAAAQACSLYTFNVADFCRIHAMWIAIGREHAGIILGRQKQLSVGGQMQRILRLRAARTPKEMRNQVVFLNSVK